MRKGNILLAALMLVLLLVSGCGHKEAKTETYSIPWTYWSYTGTTKEAGVDSFNELGQDYCTSAKVVDDHVEIELTEQQREKLIERNNTYIAELVDEFKAYNSEYRYEPDETYQKVALYFDENIPTILHVSTFYNITACYGMNYMLTNHVAEWNVELSIYNCHTDKLVAFANVPYDSVSYGPEEWAASYQ